jgi:hypothetical protein
VTAPDFLRRLDAVHGRLRRHAELPPQPGLTAPDPPSGERWDWGQVWAHLAEFIPYWTDQVRLALAWKRGAPMAFGRVKSDPERVAAIERDRRRPVAELRARLDGHISDLRSMIETLPPEGWTLRVAHPTLGTMDMREVFEEFLVGHLEQHAAQLDGLTGDSGGRGSR